MTIFWLLGIALATPTSDQDIIVSTVEPKKSVEEAEIFRLREEMNRFQESGALQYSERVYKQMLDVDSKQQWMTDSDHLAGAMASNSRGDLAETLNRLERCVDSERAIKWRSFLWSETGPVKIDSQSEAELTIMMGLLGPDQIAALDFANEQLRTQRTFIGRLPNGAYQYGTKQFIVSATGMSMASSASAKTSATSTSEEPSKTRVGSEKNRKEKLAKMNSKTREFEKPQSSGGIGAAVGVTFLGEGIMIETKEVFSDRTLSTFDIRPQVTVTNNIGYIIGELGTRIGNHETTSALMFIPSLTFGKAVGPLNLGIRTSLDIAKLTFHEIDYIKRSVGYTFGLRGNYCPIDNMCIEAQLEGGVLGSHSVFSTNVGALYSF